MVKPDFIKNLTKISKKLEHSKVSISESKIKKI